MKLHFVYNIEKDIENFINGTRAVNSKKPTKFQITFSEKYGDDFETEKVKAFIEEQDKINDFDVNKKIVAVEERWKIAEPIFIERVEKIFGISYPAPITTVYLTHDERCTYNIEQNYFFVRIGSEFSNNTLMHELLHFYTWHAFGKKLLDDGLSKLAYNDIKESLTELLNLEFSDLMNGKPDGGYPQHQEMRAEIKKLWLEKKGIKAIIDDLLGNEKFKEKDWQGAIRGIIFDFGDVICFWKTEGLGEARSLALGLPKETIKNIILEYLNAAHEGTYHSVQDYFERGNPQATVDAEIVAEVFDEMEESATLDQKMVELIALLKPKYKIALLSNFPKGIEDYLTRRFNIEYLFDVAISSYNIQKKKPSLDAYHYVSNQLLLKSEECLFIDDSETNVLAAREIGMHGLIFKNFEDCKEQLERILGRKF